MNPLPLPSNRTMVPPFPVGKPEPKMVHPEKGIVTLPRHLYVPAGRYTGLPSPLAAASAALIALVSSLIPSPLAPNSLTLTICPLTPNHCAPVSIHRPWTSSARRTRLPAVPAGGRLALG